ncbi:class I SAM-dependent methyltransferase [Catellatospora paridis]|uniref:class I SAM-dependent methyltransferase n=1 Tax=Catellatospora paridis TaxID=1617086 RepID=UPI0012D3C616|nr:class I SAM-dependent methyltransferase [Catellatospora paridis]
MTTAILSAAHREHLADLRGRPAIIDGEGLMLGSQYVMFFAEAGLMRRHAARLVAGVSSPDVLEIGLGLGVFAEQLASMGPGTYTAVEPHPGTAQLARERVLYRYGGQATVIAEPWQLVTFADESYDAIMYDTWPPDGLEDSDFATFVAEVAVRCLRPGGRFSYFHSGTTLSPTRRDVLKHHFASVTAHPYELPKGETPVAWTKPTRQFLIPVATKGLP